MSTIVKQTQKMLGELDKPQTQKKALNTPFWLFNLTGNLLFTQRTETLFEAINTATSVNVTLLTGVERVARRAYV